MLYNNDDLNVAGLPSSPLVSSGELSSSRDSYLLAWHTTSFTDILQYQVLYRRLPVSFFSNFLLLVILWSLKCDNQELHKLINRSIVLSFSTLAASWSSFSSHKGIKPLFPGGLTLYEIVKGFHVCSNFLSLLSFQFSVT